MHYRYAFSLVLLLFLTNATLRAQCPVTVNAGDDIFLCAPPTPVQLNGDIDGQYLSFQWSPVTGMTGANTLSPTVNVTQTTAYVLTVRAADLNNNLIDNGDFEGGNSGFTSDYIYNPGNLVPEGYYDVLDNPQDDHPGFAPCDDHTSGSGNMMAVNGAGTPNQDVWCQTVSVTPNTQYVFSAWVATLVAASPAILQFSINGSVLGNPFSAPGSTCNWINFFTTWNSGGNTSASICIVNQNTVLGGNDFALDDIVFSPVCQVKDTVVVHVVSVQAAATPAFAIIPCDGANLTLSGAGSSTGPNITYQWDTPNGNIVSGGSTLNPVVNAAGTYTLTVTFDNGSVECTKTATVTVIESPNQLAAWIDQPPPLGCGSPVALLPGHSSQPAFSTYQWTAGPGGNIVSGQNSPTAQVNQPGDYTLLVTNTSTGCTAEATVTVTAATNPPVSIATASGPITCAQPLVNLSGAGSSTGANITYAWYALVGGSIVSGQTAQNAVVNGPGSYVLTVTNTTNGCTAVDTAIVASTATPPVLSIAAPAVFDCDTDTLGLSSTVTPVSSVLNWTASGGGNVVAGQNSLTPQIVGPGTYVLLATDTLTGCAATDTVTVNGDFAPPVAVASGADTITCQQTSVVLSGAGSSAGANFNYHWTAGTGGNIVSGAATLSPVVNAAAIYTLLVTNTVNACTAIATVAVAADANAITAIANAPDTLTCAAVQVTLDANGSSAIAGLSYQWSTTNGVIVAGGGTPNPTVSAPGIYQLLLTNPANGCTATDLAEVAQDVALPSLSIALPDTLTCAAPLVQLAAQNNSPAGNFQYVWTASGGGNIVSGDSTLNPLVNAAGTYTLLATNLTNGCTAQTGTTVAIEVGTPTALAAVPGPITCAQPLQTIGTAGSSLGPNFTYLWATSGGGHIASGGTGPSPVVDAPGTYALTITNTDNGCTATTSVTVSADVAIPPAEAGPDGLLNCYAPVFSLSANNGLPAAGLVFSWKTADGNFTGNPDNADVSCDQPGTYVLTVLNPQNGCSDSDTAFVSANLVPPAVSILPPAKLTCVQTTLLLGTSGGNDPNFTYEWQTAGGQFVSGQFTAAPLVNAPGVYNLLVTNPVNGCTTADTVTVEQDIAVPSVSVSTPSVLTCTLKQTTLQATVPPGPGIALEWKPSGGGNIVSGLNSATPTVDQPGDYLLTVTNTANGCVNTAGVTVLQNTAPPTVSAGPDATLSCTLVSLTLQGSASAPGGGAYAWTASGGGNILSGGNTLAPQIDQPGTYTLVVTDLVNGCSASDIVTVLEDANAPAATAATPGILTCAVPQLTLQGSGSVGPNFTYQWTASAGGNILSGANTLTPVIDKPGIYTLVVKNLNNGCTATAQSAVNQNITPPQPAIAPPGKLTCAVTALSLSGTPTGPGLGYFWQTPNGFIIVGGATATPQVGLPGTYSMIVTDLNNGCSATATTQVQIDTLHPAISAAAPLILTCAVLQVPLVGTVTQPAGNFTTQWSTANGHFVSGQNTLTPSVDKPGLYVLSVQNQQNGCTTSATATVSLNIAPPSADAGPAPTLTCAKPQEGLDGSASAGQGLLTFIWTGGQIVSGAATPTPVVSAPGTYTLIVYDAANGCTASATVTVAQNITPPLAAVTPSPLLSCILPTVVLNGSASNSGAGFALQWITDLGHFVSGQNTLTPTVDAPGIYMLIITNLQNGCTASVPVAVGIDVKPPNAEAGPPAELHCNQPQVTLQGSSILSFVTFAWSSADGHFSGPTDLATPSVDAPGTYLLTVTNTLNGCTATDQTVVTQVPLPAFSPLITQPNCLKPKGVIRFDNLTGGVPPFTYSIDQGLSTQASPAFPNLLPGDYELLLTDAKGCTAAQTVTLDDALFPGVTLPPWYLILQGDSVQLQPETIPLPDAIAHWQWSPADGLSCDTCPTPWASPLYPALYRLTVTDENGCTAQARVEVRVNRNRQLYAPNVISPNGDGDNDVFLIYGRGVVKLHSLRIFDRWGSQVFERKNIPVNDESVGWDGRFRGQDLQPAVFVWQAEVEFVDGFVEVFTGDVTIMR